MVEEAPEITYPGWQLNVQTELSCVPAVQEAALPLLIELRAGQYVESKEQTMEFPVQAPFVAGVADNVEQVRDVSPPTRV